MYEIGTKFVDHSDKEVDAFVVIGRSSNTYQLAELWRPGDGEKRWQQYRNKINTLHEREDLGEVRPLGEVDEDTVEGIRRMARGWGDDWEFVADVYSIDVEDW